MLYPDPSRFSDEFRKHLKDIASLEHYQKGKTLLSPSEPNNKSWYIQKGIAKIYYYVFDEKHNKKQIITCFLTECDTLNCVDSFFRRETNHYYIELIEDSSLYVVTKTQFEECYDLFPEAHEVAKDIILGYKKKNDLRTKLLCLDASQRYYEFNKIFNTSRLSVGDLSAYLHVSRTHLNRIRKGK